MRPEATCPGQPEDTMSHTISNRTRLLLSTAVILLATLAAFPGGATAQTYDLGHYVIPNCDTPKAYNATGTGMRRFIPMGIDGSGRAHYVYVTSGDGAAFLDFTIDSSYIRFWADASWAHNNHPPAPECGGSDYCDEVSGPVGVATSTCRCLWYHGWGSADYVFNAPRDYSNQALGARFLPRSVYLSGTAETTVSLGNSVTRARRKSDCSSTTSWHSSAPGSYQSSSVAISHYSSYNGFNDVIRVRTVSGPGTGEIFYYAKGSGWVGYQSGSYSDWITTASSSTPWPNLSCFSYSQGSFCSVVDPNGGGGGVGNNAQVLTGESSVPSSLTPYETRQVRVRVKNTGGTTWTAGTLYRLGAQTDNGVTWSAFSCGGYMNNLADGRVYLCNNVAPNASYDFVFNVTAPASGTPHLSVKMVRDGVEWFGSGASWSITVGGGNPYPNCPCSAGIDNYCLHSPSTYGCPMTYPGGYCDPNGNGTFDDADWVLGYYEFQDYCG